MMNPTEYYEHEEANYKVPQLEPDFDAMYEEHREMRRYDEWKELQLGIFDGE